MNISEFRKNFSDDKVYSLDKINYKIMNVDIIEKKLGSFKNFYKDKKN